MTGLPQKAPPHRVQVTSRSVHNELVKYSATRILTVDLGSTYFKCALVNVEPQGTVALERIVRRRVAQARWAPREATRRFEAAVADIVNEARKLTEAAGPAAISLTGVREGVAVCRRDGKLLRAVGNAEAITWQIRYGRDWLAEILAQVETGDAVLMSLQGWLGSVLTGRLAITESELQSWSIGVSDGSLPSSCAGLDTRFFPTTVAVGAEIGRSRLLGGIGVAIAGTDEHASHWGSGLGRGASTEFGAGTYWSLSRVLSPSHTPDDLPQHIRVLPKTPPYPRIASYVGYRWGEFLSDLQAGRRPSMPETLPPWSKSRFIDELRERRCMAVGRALQLVCDDLRRASASLPSCGADVDVVVHGGGSGADQLAREVARMNRWRSRIMKSDPTLIGSALVAIESIRSSRRDQDRRLR